MSSQYLSRFLLLLLFVSLSISAHAQVDDESTSAKVDSIYALQQKMYDENKNNPLFGKNYGIEVNPVRLLFITDSFTFSGGFSLFDVDRGAEIAFPVFLQIPDDSDYLSEFTLDAHYRYFMGNTQNGFYLSTFARYAYLEGVLGDVVFFDEEITSNERGSEHKLGIGFGLGWRKFSYRGLYWGTSFSVGRYLIGENEKFASNLLDIDNDNEIIVNFEFLKFGWAF